MIYLYAWNVKLQGLSPESPPKNVGVDTWGRTYVSQYLSRGQAVFGEVVELVLGKELEEGQWTDRLYVISELAVRAIGGFFFL